MKRRDLLKKLPLAAAAPALPLINSCATNGLSLGPGLTPQYLINTQMILSKLLPFFPFKQNVSGLANLSLIQPTFAMAPDINKVRIGLGLTAAASQGLGALTGIPALDALSGRSTNGRAQVACGLRYDKATRGIYLKEPNIEQLDLANIPSQYTNSARGLLNTFGPQLLDKRPIHTLDSSLATSVLKSMTVQNNGIALGFGLI